MNLPIADAASSAPFADESEGRVVDTLVKATADTGNKASKSLLHPVKSEARDENVPISFLIAPTRPMSAYNLYFHLQRQRLLAHDGDVDKLTEENYQFTSDDIAKFADEQRMNSNKKKMRRPHRKTHGKISFTELAKKIASGWNGLDDDSRSLFHGYFEVEMKRYKKELNEYKKKCDKIIHSEVHIENLERKQKQNKTTAGKRKQTKEEKSTTRNKEDKMHEVSKKLLETIMETINKVKDNNDGYDNDNEENSSEKVEAVTKQFLSELLSDTLKKGKKNNTSFKFDNEEDLCDLMTEALNKRKNNLKASKLQEELNSDGIERNVAPVTTCSIVSSAEIDDMESETEHGMMNSERDGRKWFNRPSDKSVRSAPPMRCHMPMRSSMDHIGHNSQQKKWWNPAAMCDVASVKSAPSRANCLMGLMKRKQFEMMKSLSYGTTNPNFNQYKRRSLPGNSHWRPEADEEMMTMNADEEMMMMMSNQNRQFRGPMGMNHNNGSYNGMNSMSYPTSSHFKPTVTTQDLMMLRQQNRMLYQQMNQNNFSSNGLNNDNNFDSDEESIPNMYDQRQHQQTDELLGAKLNINHNGIMNPHAAVDDAFRLACSTIMNDQELFENMTDDDDNDACEENEGFIDSTTNNVLPNFSERQLEDKHRQMLKESFQYPDSPMNPSQIQSNLLNHHHQQQTQEQIGRRVSMIMSPSSCEDEYDDDNEFNDCLGQQQGQHSMSMMSNNNAVSNGIMTANSLLSDYQLDTNIANQSFPNSLHRNNVSNHSFTQSNEIINNNGRMYSVLGNIDERLMEPNM